MGGCGCRTWQVDMMLAGGVLWAHPKVTNPNSHDLPGYWWTCVAMRSTPKTRVLAAADLSEFPCTPWPYGAHLLPNVTFEGPQLPERSTAWAQDMSFIGNIPAAHDFFMHKAGIETVSTAAAPFASASSNELLCSTGPCPPSAAASPLSLSSPTTATASFTAIRCKPPRHCWPLAVAFFQECQQILLRTGTAPSSSPGASRTKGCSSRTLWPRLTTPASSRTLRTTTLSTATCDYPPASQLSLSLRLDLGQCLFADELH